MPEYEARILELKKEVAALHAQAVKDATAKQTKEEKDKDEKPIIVEATYLRLGTGVLAFAAVREKALVDSLALVKPRADATAESHTRIWSEHFQKAWAEAFKILLDLVERDEDPIQLKFELLVVQESVGVAALSNPAIIEAVGDIRAKMRELETSRVAKRAEWRDLAALDDRQDGPAAVLRIRVLEDFKKAVQDVRGWWPRIEEAVRNLFRLWKAKEDADPEPSVADGASTIMETLGTLQRTLDEVERAARSIYAGEEAVHQMFANTRLQVKEFLQNNSKEKILQRYVDARAVAEAAIAKCATPGQRDDAKRHYDKVVAESIGILGEFNDTFDDYYAEFDGTYTGTVSQTTIEILTEEEMFKRFWQEVEDLNLPAEIQRLREMLDRTGQISIDEMSEEQRKKWKDAIETRMNELKEKIRSLDMSFVERFKLLFYHVPRAQLVEKLRRLEGYIR